MRHLPQNYQSGDQLEITLSVKAELLSSQAGGDCQVLTLKVLEITNASNGKRAKWTQTSNGTLELRVPAGMKQRLLAVGLSARQKTSLKQRFAGLTAKEASELLTEISGADSQGPNPVSGDSAATVSRPEKARLPIE